MDKFKYYCFLIGSITFGLLCSFFSVAEKLSDIAKVFLEKKKEGISPYDKDSGPEALWNKITGVVEEKLKWLGFKGFNHEVRAQGDLFDSHESETQFPNIEGMRSTCQNHDQEFEQSEEVTETESNSEIYTEETSDDSSKELDAPPTEAELIQEQLEKQA